MNKDARNRESLLKSMVSSLSVLPVLELGDIILSYSHKEYKRWCPYCEVERHMELRFFTSKVSPNWHVEQFYCERCQLTYLYDLGLSMNQLLIEDLCKNTFQSMLNFLEDSL